MSKNSEPFNHNNKHLILRDHLSADRTILSAQRTHLAYIRTALTLFIAGVSLIKFFDALILHIIGWLMFPAAIFTVIMGFSNYAKIKKLVSKIELDHVQNDHSQ